MGVPKSNPVRVQARVRDLQVLDLKIAGATYAEIGKALGISEPAACKAFYRALERNEDRVGEKADEMRLIENARLGKLLKAIWPACMRGDIKAVNAALRVNERICRMNGLEVLRTELTGADGGPLKVEDTCEVRERVAYLIARYSATGDPGSGDSELE